MLARWGYAGLAAVLRGPATHHSVGERARAPVRPAAHSAASAAKLAAANSAALLPKCPMP